MRSTQYRQALEELATATIQVVQLESELAQLDTFAPGHTALQRQISAAEFVRREAARRLHAADQDDQTKLPAAS
jgi:hypothetical protein